MKAGLIYILFFLFLGQILLAQDTKVVPLDEVQVYSPFSPKLQVGYTITRLSDSILKAQNTSLVALLKKYTNIYIKEQGKGMVASISMRGSGASHTAVYWNGIPINSSLNGQTDFNTLFSSAYNKISIRKGGGSVLLGSGAIGGAINLENELKFSNTNSGLVSLSLGSYQRLTTAISLQHSTEKILLEVNYNTLIAANAYQFYDTDIYNENAEINHYALQLNAGVKLNKQQQLYVKTQYNNSNRNTARTLYSTSNANLSYGTHTALVGWKNTSTNYQTELKTAYVKEDYTYIFNKIVPNVLSKNGSEKWFSNYDFFFRLTDKIKLRSGLNYEMIFGQGTAIQNSKRTRAALYASWHHRLSNQFIYHVNIRKDWSTAYKIPFVFSIDSKQKWHKNHSTKLNFSTNYRTPTINDLYWENAGNLNLKPEKNWSAEVAYEGQFTSLFSNKNKWITQTTFNLYHSQSTNLIQWIPVTSFFWKPINVQQVRSQGLEFDLETSLQKNRHLVSGKIQYSYTLSKDMQLNKQLIYVPKHMGGFVMSFSNKNWIFDFEEAYNGRVFTTASNSSSMDAYWLSNVSLKRKFFNNRIGLSVAINNLFNKHYEIKLSRPMPKRNYSIQFNYKF